MNPSAIYIHIPFCSHKCLFCSFAIAVAQTHKIDQYIDCLEKEIKAYQAKEIQSVYLGGGTPSMFSCEQLIRLMNIVRKNFKLHESCEITMEANPEGIAEEKVRVMKDLGVNRISLGVQSLNDRYLKFLGRKHDSTQAVRAYEILRKEKFTNINLDLMYAFPSQTQEELEHDVRSIAALGSEHLSLYTLTIEPHSRFYANAVKLDDEEKIAQGYLSIMRWLREYGFQQYEVSNFSKKGFQCRHNKNYWAGGRYLGLGMGAHGFIENRRYWNSSKLQGYLEDPLKPEGFEDLDENTIRIEKLIFGLRMNEGVDQKLILADKKDAIERLIREGFLEITEDRLMVTDQGRLVLDEIAVRLV